MDSTMPPSFPFTANIAANEKVTLRAVAAAGHSFVGWRGDATGNAEATSVTMTCAKSVTAVFAPQTFHLSATVDGDTGGTVRVESGSSVDGPDSAFAYGTRVSVRAAAAPGYRFSHWSGAVQGADNPITLTIESDVSLVAHFHHASGFSWWWLAAIGGGVLGLLVFLRSRRSLPAAHQARRPD